jgi:hypothetical protein
MQKSSWSTTDRAYRKDGTGGNCLCSRQFSAPVHCLLIRGLRLVSLEARIVGRDAPTGNIPYHHSFIFVPFFARTLRERLVLPFAKFLTFCVFALRSGIVTAVMAPSADGCIRIKVPFTGLFRRKHQIPAYKRERVQDQELLLRHDNKILG